jgi:dienelactone hydrolase
MNWHDLVVKRRARIGVLGDPATADELWLVVHGYGQLVADFLPACRGLAGPTRAVVAPEALNRFYKVPEGHEGSHGTVPVGTTWMTREHRLAEIADYVDYLDDVVQAMRRPGAHLAVLGFSQGVTTVARWVAAGRTRVDRVVCWAGELPADVDLAATRDRWPDERVDLVVGERDEFRTWIGPEQQAERFAAAGITARVTAFAGGHRLDRATLQSLASR